VGSDSALEIDSITAADVGDYYVVVSDGAVSMTSRTAALTLADDSIAVPEGLVAWWRAENNGLDYSGAHNAIVSGATFTAEELDKHST